MNSGEFTDPFGNAAAGSAFEVYPESLRAATDDDVGMLGAQAGVVQKFNEAIAHLREKTNKGAMQLERFAEALDKAADYYETQDEEDFKRLRDLEKGLN
jgi:hypothetical protein